MEFDIFNDEVTAMGPDCAYEECTTTRCGSGIPRVLRACYDGSGDVYQWICDCPGS